MRRGYARFGALAVVMVAASMALVAPSHAGDPDYSWPPQLPGDGSIGFILNDNFSWDSFVSVPMSGSQPNCTSMDDPACSGPAQKHGWWIPRAAPPCDQALPWEECVEGLAVSISDGRLLHSDLVGLVPGKRQFPADPDKGLPTGSAMSLWTDPTDPAGDTGFIVDLSGQMGGREGPFHFNTFAAQITRYRLGAPGAQGTCLWFQADACPYRIAFDEGTRLHLSILMNRQLTGWLSGRLQDPNVTVEPARADLNRITVDALPVDLPMVAVGIPVSEASDAINAYWHQTFTCAGPTPCTDGVMGVESAGPHAFELLRLFTAALGDTAIKVLPTWSIASMNASLGPPSCISGQNSLVGLVTTNSTAYASGPPVFANSSLKYSVASLHRLPSGQPLEGTYDLVMRSDAARCLYGFSDAPLQAEIQVTSEDGVEQAVTTSLSERDGWIHLAAYGFHFSQPTISVKLTSQAKTTIVCKKHKRIRKVTGVNPVCPVGWRKVGP